MPGIQGIAKGNQEQNRSRITPALQKSMVVQKSTERSKGRLGGVAVSMDS
jgi:hypothetical protein